MARRKNGSTKAPSLQKMAIYFFAFAVPPVILGTLLAFRSITELMIRKAPDQALIAESTKLAGPSPKFTSHKPRAVILMSSAGTEISDLLGAYDVLSESGALEVVTAAPERRLSPTTSDLAVVPDFALADAPQADLLVLPAIQDPGNLAILDWVRKQAAGARVILSLGEGARMLAQAGLLENHRVTTHVLALANLRQLVPQAKWEDSSRVVRDQRLISSAGMSATPEAALAALEQIAGSAVAHKTAQALGIVPLLGR
ncbi:MAG: DJ-1/PfpI family protein, partial [Bdellovibrionota bacterium]